MEGNICKRKSWRRWGESLDQGAGVTSMKEKGKERGLGGKCHRLQSSSKKFQLSQWKVLEAKSPICQEWTFLPVPRSVTTGNKHLLGSAAVVECSGSVRA